MAGNSNGSLQTIERAGVIVAAGASLSLFLSFVYDWGFLSALGISFGDAPTSLSDHVASWMVWAQILLPGVFLAFTINLFVKRLDTKKDGTIVDRDRWWTHRDPLLIVAAAGPVLLWLLVGSRFPWWALPIVWIVFASWTSARPITMLNVSTSTMRIVLAMSVLSIWLFLSVYMAGRDSVDLDTTDIEVYHIEYPVDSLGASPVWQQAYLIRSFPNWLVVREADDSTSTVRWIRSEQVDRIEFSVDEMEPFSGLLCVLLNWCIDRSRREFEGGGEMVESEKKGRQ